MRCHAAIALTAFAVAGCASKSSEISASYVSPIMYQNHSCAQLAQEAQGVSTRAAQVAGAQDQKRSNDAVATGVAVVIFWPAAFLVSGDGPTAAELANLKGQMNALEQASIQKRCGISFQRSAEGGPPPAVSYVQPEPAAVPPPAPTRSKQASQPSRSAPAARPPVAAITPPVTVE
jgi:hypothetical protein